MPRRARLGRRRVVNPGAWTHYSYAIRDALELFTVPVVEVHLSNVDEREDWRQQSVIADVVTCRVIGKGPEGYRDALQYLAVEAAMSRIDRLRASLEEPLLVTNGVNVRYLVGFSSSNAALFVEPERVRLFSDFRYAEAARAVEGVEFVETKRSLVAALAELLEGSVGFEADAVSYASWEVLRAGGLELVPRRGLVEALRAVKDEAELDAIRRAGEITSEAYARFAEERFVGRTERELAWRLDELFHELGADAPAFETIVASGPNSAQAARAADRPHDRGRRDGRGRRGRDGRRLQRRLHAHVRHRPAAGRAEDRLRGDARGPAGRPRSDAGRRHRRGRRRRGARQDRGGRLRRELRPRPRPRRRARGARGAAPLARVRATRSQAGNVATVEPGVYLEGLGGIRIEDLVVVTDGEPEVLTSLDKDLITVS